MRDGAHTQKASYVQPTPHSDTHYQPRIATRLPLTLINALLVDVLLVLAEWHVEPKVRG